MSLKVRRSFLILFVSALFAQQSAGPRELLIGDWAVSGYLENGTKAYLTIQGKKIIHISQTKPETLSEEKILETQDWISPAFIDLHNHLSYSVLPLWMNARGQFDNRFEWRDQKVKKQVGYEEATTLQMQPFNPRPDSLSAHQKKLAEISACAAIRWAELKAMLGGSAVTQGYMGESLSFEDVAGRGLSCAESFLISNVEISEDLTELPNIRSKTDLVDDLVSWGINEPYIYPLMKEKNISYDEALKIFLSEKKFFEWAEDFNLFSRSVANGLRLALARDLPPEWEWIKEFEDPNNIPARSQLEAHKEDIYNFFLENLNFKVQSETRPNNVDNAVDSLISWIYGPRSNLNSAFLKSKATSKSLTDQFKRQGIYRIRPYVVQEFINDFYFRIYQPLMRDKEQENFKLIAHLAEGNPQHPLTQREFKDVIKMGLAFDNSIMIHGLGVDDEDIAYAKNHNINFVWSPLSNLLLYGETADIPKLLSKGINISLGPDWAATGSKNLLYELKAARALFDKWIEEGAIDSFSNKELLAFVTQNPAKALSMESLLGTLKEGAYANFLIVNKQSSNLYDDILKSTENDLKLIVATGIPRSGESDWMSQLLRPYKDHLEKLDEHTECVKNKSLFLKDPNLLDEKLINQNTPPLDTLKNLRHTVESARDRQRTTATEATRSKLLDIDPLFDCDSPKARERLNQTITQATNATKLEKLSDRLKIRTEQGLNEAWQSKYQR